MEKILNNLLTGEKLHTTDRGTNYLFVRRDRNMGVTYSINRSRKTLPLVTINAALEAYNMGKIIDRQWYKNYNQKEYVSRPCNFSVLKELLNRIKQN